MIVQAVGVCASKNFRVTRRPEYDPATSAKRHDVSRHSPWRPRRLPLALYALTIPRRSKCDTRCRDYLFAPRVAEDVFDRLKRKGLIGGRLIRRSAVPSKDILGSRTVPFHVLIPGAVSYAGAKSNDRSWRWAQLVSATL